MDIYTQLKEAGLLRSESTIYLYLLENGLTSPPQIAKGTKIARTNCYHILHNLKERGLIEQQTRGKHKAYLASDPEAITRSLERKKETFNRLLPDLRAIYTTQKNKPKIRFYDGIEQIKEIYLQTLSSKEIFGIGSSKQLSDIAPEFYVKYLEEIKNRGIFFHDILSNPSKEKSGPQMQSILKGFYDLRYLPSKNQDLTTDILIWEDNIALLSLEEPVFGTILTNQSLTKTFKIVFQNLYDGLGLN
ncbi:MAG: helix-turn-helix domain-containing protein [bacterium]|nr:helix-turn-helix domain-containing protein [bacterium]